MGAWGRLLAPLRGLRRTGNWATGLARPVPLAASKCGSRQTDLKFDFLSLFPDSAAEITAWQQNYEDLEKCVVWGAVYAAERIVAVSRNCCRVCTTGFGLEHVRNTAASQLAPCHAHTSSSAALT